MRRPGRGLRKGFQDTREVVGLCFMCLSVVPHIQNADFMASLSLVLSSNWARCGPHHAVDTCQSITTPSLSSHASTSLISLPRVSTSDAVDDLAVRMPVLKSTAAVAAVVLMGSTPASSVGACSVGRPCGAHVFPRARRHDSTTDDAEERRKTKI